MKVHVVSPKYIQIMQSTKLMIKGAFLKVFVASLVLISVHLLQMYTLFHSSDAFGKLFFFKADLSLEDTYTREQVGSMQRVNFLAMVLMLNFLSIGLESNNVLKKNKDKEWHSVNPMFLN